MRLTVVRIAVVLCVCMSLVSADVAHLKAAKSRLASRLVGKHHKRGILSHVPPYKLGHDIPLVTHSLVKPLVVTYPPTASVTAVKVPLSHPFAHRYPAPVGHKVPVPHPHYGLNFPHTKTVLLPKPDHHFHHHHHHLEPKPVLPVVPADPIPATPVVPVAQPSGTVVHPLPAPPPVIVRPEPVLPSHHVPVGPPPLHLVPHGHIDVKPILPAATVSLQPAAVPLPPAPVAPAPVFPLAHQFPYVIRPGNAVQTSYFATYPRYPLLNYNTIFPLSPPVAPAPIAPVSPLLFNRPAVPSFHLVPQAAGGEGVLEQPRPTVHLEPTPAHVHPTQFIPQPTVHLQPTQPAIHLQPTQPSVHLQPTQPAIPFDHSGWSPVPAQPHDITSTQHTEAHFPQAQDSHHFTQQQGTQVFEQHTGNDQQYHDLQQHLQHHIQQQIDQAQYEQHINNQHQLSHEYGLPQQEYSQQNHDFSQQDYSQQDFSQQGQDFSQQAHDYAQAQEYAQHAHDYAQHEQQYNQQQFYEQQYNDQQYNQQQFNEQQYNLQQPGQEYGLPHAEGRSEDTASHSTTEGEGEQRYHNHIPLGLQLPLDRPLDHFR